MNAEAKKPLKLFYCYARKDKEMRDELDIHLAGLKRRGQITSWYDGEIGAGADWEAEIDAQLREAHIILLLVTPHFIASEYCYSVEMLHALKRHQDGTARVVPIILQRTYRWEDAPFGGLQALPTDAKPVSQWPVREDALWDIAAGIDKVIDDLRFQLKTAQEWFDEGSVLYDLNRYEDAILAFDHAIRLYPNFARAYYNKGVTLENLNRHEDAILAFDHAILLDPNDAFAYTGKGLALHSLYRYKNAILAFDYALRLEPNFAPAYNSKGVALHNLNRYKDAILAFDHAIRLDPNSAITYNNKGMALEKLGKSKEAQQCYEKAQQLESTNNT